MKFSIASSTILVGAFMAALPSVGASDGVFHIDGGNESGWEDGWYIQVDGVMGGKSSGNMEFLQDNSVMKFTGDINLDGGGFSSVRRRVNLDLSEYTGVVVTLEADQRRTAEGNLPPIGLELQFDDRTSRYDFSSAFSVPLSSDNGDGPVVSSVYLPIESFDRGTFIGFVCRDNCQFDPSQINGISVYVLFQEGGFDVRLQSIEAVKEPRSFPVPEYDVIESEDAIALIQSTIASGGGLYDKGYTELCIAMYWSVLNTIFSTDVASDAIQAVICAGLKQNEGDSKENIAWTLRHTMDAVIADLQGSSRLTVQDWLPTSDEATAMEVQCLGRTSAAPGYMYDPTNQYMLVSDTVDNEEEGTLGNNENVVESEEAPTSSLDAVEKEPASVFLPEEEENGDGSAVDESEEKSLSPNVQKDDSELEIATVSGFDEIGEQPVNDSLTENDDRGDSEGSVESNKAEIDDDAIGNATFSYQDMIEESIAKREEAMQQQQGLQSGGPTRTFSFNRSISAMLGLVVVAVLNFV